MNYFRLFQKCSYVFLRRIKVGAVMKEPTAFPEEPKMGTRATPIEQRAFLQNTDFSGVTMPQSTQSSDVGSANKTVEPLTGIRGSTARTPWRRGGDSNPRYHCWHTGFRNRRIQPLCHLSSFKRVGEANGGRPFRNPAVVAAADPLKSRHSQFLFHHLDLDGR